MNNSERFDTALYAVGENVSQYLIKLSDTVKANCEEIRLRKGLPIALTVAGETAFVKKSGQVCFNLCADLPKVSGEDIAESFKLLCGGSAFAHENELKDGYVVMKNGCRAGVCGRICESGFMSDVSSVNIRIAREIFGAANEVIKHYKGSGLLIAGPAGCGKTTVLRDFIRQISSGAYGKPTRVCVIDSRLELSGGTVTSGGNDLGADTDLLITPDKAHGIEIALRTMFPEMVAFDEIGTAEELRGVEQSFHSGIKVVTTAHIGSKAELMERSVTAELINSGMISQVALLPRIRGGKIEVFDAKELKLGAVV